MSVYYPYLVSHFSEMRYRQNVSSDVLSFVVVVVVKQHYKHMLSLEPISRFSVWEYCRNSTNVGMTKSSASTTTTTTTKTTNTAAVITTTTTTTTILFVGLSDSI